MLIALLALIATFVVARSLVLRYGGKRGPANIVAASIVCAFFAGFISRAIVFPERSVNPAPVAVAPAPATAAPTPTLPGTAVSPLHRALNRAQLGALLPQGKAVSYSVIESLGGAGPNGDQFLSGSTIVIHGWAADPTTKSTAAGLLLIVDGKDRIDATAGYGGDRMDVATAFNTLAMLHTNVAAPLPTAGLAKGTHRLALAVIERDGRHYRIITSVPKAFVLN